MPLNSGPKARPHCSLAQRARTFGNNRLRAESPKQAVGTQLVPGLQPGSPQSRETYGAAIGYSVAAPLALNRDGAWLRSRRRRKALPRVQRRLDRTGRDGYWSDMTNPAIHACEAQLRRWVRDGAKLRHEGNPVRGPEWPRRSTGAMPRRTSDCRNRCRCCDAMLGDKTEFREGVPFPKTLRLTLGTRRQYFVKVGPAEIYRDKLVFTRISPRTKLERTFHITQ